MANAPRSASRRGAKGSNWSAINVAKIAELRAVGRLRAAGEAAFAERREDRTAVYSFERAQDAELTPEEEAEFRANAAAWAWFSARPPSFRKQTLHWVVAVKRPETRRAHLETLIQDSAAGRPIKASCATGPRGVAGGMPGPGV